MAVVLHYNPDSWPLFHCILSNAAYLLVFLILVSVFGDCIVLMGWLFGCVQFVACCVGPILNCYAKHAAHIRYFILVGGQSIVISVCVYLSVFPYVCSHISQTASLSFAKFFWICCVWSWLSPPLMGMEHVVYFWLYGWRHVFAHSSEWARIGWRICFGKFSRWHHQGQSCCVRLQACFITVIYFDTHETCLRCSKDICFSFEQVLAHLYSSVLHPCLWWIVCYASKSAIPHTSPAYSQTRWVAITTVVN